MFGVQRDLDAGLQCLSTFLLLDEMAKRQDVSITLAVSNLLPHTIATINARFTKRLRSDRIRIWHAVDPPSDCEDERSWRRNITEAIRDAFLANLQPDVILATIPYNGLLLDSCTPNGKLCENIPLAAIADYSKPTSSGHSEVADPETQDQLTHRSRFLSQTFAIFAICGSTSACQLPSEYASKFYAVPTADSEMPASAGMIVRTILDGAGKESRHVSARLCVEATGIFKRRTLNILAIKLDHLGDFLLAIPSLAKLRAKYPYAKLDIVVGSWNVDVARKLNLFENVYPFDFFKRKSSANAGIDAAELKSVLALLPQYDIAIDFRRQADSRFFIDRVEARLKVGYETLDASIDQGLDIALPMERDVAHQRTVLNETPISLQILKLVDSLPGSVNDFVRLPELVPPETRQVGTVAIFPRAGTDVREWGSKKFVELIARLKLSELVSVVHVFFVSDSESAAYHIGSNAKVRLHIGLEFSALTKILSSMNLCIANNSGGIHLAAYLGVPALGIYSGHETASEWGPQFHEGLAIHRNAHCSPCHLGRLSDCRNGNFCLGDISVDDVHAKAMEILNASSIEQPAPATGSPAGVFTQLNDDSIVKTLIVEITPHLPASNKDVLIQVASALAENHPTYRVPPESDTFRLNRTFDHSSSAIEWIGFSGIEHVFRWTDGKRAAMIFDLDLEGEIGGSASVLLVFDTFRKQRIVAKFNGVPIFDGVRRGRRILLDLPVENLSSGRNRLDLELPDAVSPGNGDNRRLAMAVRRFRVVGKGVLAPGILRRKKRIGEFLIRWR